MSSKKPMNSTGMVPLNESNICSQYSPDRWQNSKPIRKLATERIPEIIQETKRLNVERNATAVSIYRQKVEPKTMQKL